MADPCTQMQFFEVSINFHGDKFHMVQYDMALLFFLTVKHVVHIIKIKPIFFSPTANLM